MDTEIATVTAKERTNPNVRLVAKACVELAKLRIRNERIMFALHRLEPNIVIGQRYGYEAIIFDGQPFVIFCNGSVACKLTGKHAEALVSNNKAILWRLPGKRVAIEGWILFLPHVAEYEIVKWARCALVQAGMKIVHEL
jgi:hypothetical protein